MSFCSWTKGEIHKDNFSPGTYNCSECDYPLFSSEQKYKHHTPWPAFKDPVHPDSLSKVLESEGAYKVSCGKCKNPLGHEFLKDGPDGEGSSHSLKFVAKPGGKPSQL